jgi:hypothetical protein
LSRSRLLFFLCSLQNVKDSSDCFIDIFVGLNVDIVPFRADDSIWSCQTRSFAKDYAWTKLDYDGAGFSKCSGRFGFILGPSSSIDADEQTIIFGTPLVSLVM